MYPLSNISVVTPPVAEPLTLDAAKLHLRVDFGDDDALISSLIVAAREYVEQFTSRALMTRTLAYYLDQFPGIPPYRRSDVIELPRPPLISVNSLSFTDTYGTTRTWTPSGSDLLNELGSLNAHVDNVNEPGRIRLAYSQIWPAEVLRTALGVRIEYVCGYGDASDIPVGATQSMLLLIGTWYANRESVGVGRGLTTVKILDSLDMLLAPLKNWNFA